jgi:hypothetical protein
MGDVVMHDGLKTVAVMVITISEVDSEDGVDNNRITLARDMETVATNLY